MAVSYDKDYRPTPASKWLSQVANLTFFLCYDSARMKYDEEQKKQGAFGKLSSEEQGVLCAKAMDDLISKGYAKTNTAEILDMATERHRRYYDKGPNRHLWSYDAE